MMWTDNETDRDFLNFRCVANTVAEMISQTGGQPLSLGVSGGWGVGKSSMLKLIADALKERGSDGFLFVEFNAWLYQGFDDARAALMDVIASRLIEHGEKSKTAFDKAKELLPKVDWLRLTGLTAGSALAMTFGLPPVGLIGAAVSAAKGLADGNVTPDDIVAAEKAGKELAGEASKVHRSAEASSPPRQIQMIRRNFQEAIKELRVKLVVFIDDLDRCLPSTAIATLEAVRLFLFMPNTAFVIAADDRMIRHAVRSHFKDVEIDDDLVTSYFDKLVQVPLRVPPLGTQEVRAYLFMLFIENGGLGEDVREKIRQNICQRLSESWKGHRVDIKYVLSLVDKCPPELRANLETADRIAPLMTTARQIAGNPRLIKRVLNTLAIRLSIAKSQNVAVDEAALVKLILFERCGTQEAYSQLIAAINDGDEGKPEFLATWERRVQNGEAIDDLPKPWTSDFARDWLALPPAFGDMDLRPAVYVSREHMPIITSADRLSSEAIELLEALLQLTRPNQQIVDQLRGLGKRDITMLVERVLARARQVQVWGTPPAFWSLLAIVDADHDQTEAVVRLLENISPSRLQPDIVPILSTKDWARQAIDRWAASKDTPQPVSRAIRALKSED